MVSAYTRVQFAKVLERPAEPAPPNTIFCVKSADGLRAELFVSDAAGHLLPCDNDNFTEFSAQIIGAADADELRELVGLLPGIDIASLVAGKVPLSQLPDSLALDSDVIPLAQKGAANGLATLDAASRLPAAQLPIEAALAASVLPASQKGAANGLASLDGSGKVPTSQLPAAVLGALSYQGAWNAATNSPALPAANADNKGFYYVVSVGGSTAIDGVSDWQPNDWAVSNGSVWQKVDNTDAVPANRQIAAGYGMEGGGDFTADRTLSAAKWQATTDNMTLAKGCRYIVQPGHTVNLPTTMSIGEAIEILPANGDWSALGASIVTSGSWAIAGTILGQNVQALIVVTAANTFTILG